MKDLSFYGSNRLPGTDCAYFQLEYWYVIQNNKMWSRNHGSTKAITSDRIKLPDEQGIKDVDKNGYTNVGILETDKIKNK